MSTRPLPAPPAEVPVIRSLDALAPRFRAALEAVLRDVTAWGFDPMVFETMRSDARQQFLYGFGRRYDDGRGVVTHSETALDTWHHYGLAADVVSRSRLWAPDPFFWEALALAARRHGLRSGADWNNNGRSDDERFVDRPHLQWGAPMRRSPSTTAARLLREGGLERVWREVGAL